VAGVVLGVLALSAVGIVAGSDLRARSQIRSGQAALSSLTRQMTTVRTELAAAQQRLTRAQAGHGRANRSFAATQATLSATQATLAHDEAGITADGIDVGTLDTCLSTVEQALNQLAVGQTAGGLASLRASSSPCAILDGTT
jgi:chromosome segregation ATPase